MYLCFSGDDLLQIRGQNGLLHNCMDPLAEVSGKQEVADTADHVLESFYPVSPTIGLQKIHVYKEGMNSTGEESPSGLIVVHHVQASLRLSTAQRVLLSSSLQPNYTSSLWSTQVSGETTLTLMPTRFTSWRELMPPGSSVPNSSEPRW